MVSQGKVNVSMGDVHIGFINPFLIRVLPSEEFIRHDAQRVNIGRRGVRVAFSTPLFGGHVSPTPDCLIPLNSPRQALFDIHLKGKPKVRQIGSSAVCTDEDILRFDVAVNHFALFKSIRQRGCHLLQPCHREAKIRSLLS